MSDSANNETSGQVKESMEGILGQIQGLQLVGGEPVAAVDDSVTCADPCKHSSTDESSPNRGVDANVSTLSEQSLMSDRASDQAFESAKESFESCDQPCSTASEEHSKSVDTDASKPEPAKDNAAQEKAGEQTQRDVDKELSPQSKTYTSIFKTDTSRGRYAEPSQKRQNTHVAQFIAIAASRRPKSMPRKRLANILNDVQDNENVNIETNEKECGGLDIVVRGRSRDVDRAINELLIKLSVPDRVPIPSNLSEELLRLHFEAFHKLEISLDCRLLVAFGERTVHVHCCNDQGAEVAVRSVLDFFESLGEATIEQLTVQRMYHPWIRGAFGRNLDFIRKETDTLIRLPSSDRSPEEITVCGHRDNVNRALAMIHQSYKDLLVNMKSATFDLTQAQYTILRENSQNSIDRIMDKCGVSVEIAMPNTPSTHVVLRGQSNSSIGEALSMINSLKTVASEKVPVPVILHGLIKSKLPIFKGNFPLVSIDMVSDGVVVSGPPGNVSRMKDHLANTIGQLLKCFTKETMKIDTQQQEIIYRDFNRRCKQYLNEHNVLLDRTKDPSVVSLEGQGDAIEAVKNDLLHLCDRAKSEVSKTVSIGQEYHGRLIGTRGANVSKIKNEFDVTIQIPYVDDRSNDITITGSPMDVDKCIERIKEYVDEIKKTETIESMTVPKSFHRLIIGHRGSKIQEIRRATKAVVEIPAPNDPSEIIRLRGYPNEVEEAHKMIKSILDSFTEELIELPIAAYFYLKRSSSFSSELRRSFPQVIVSEQKHTKGNTPYHLILRGYRNDVDRCIKFINSEKFQAMKHYTVQEFPISSLQRSFIENNCKRLLRDITNNLKVFIEYTIPPRTASDRDGQESPMYVLYGKCDDVKEATELLKETLSKIGDVCECKVSIPIAVHDRFRRREELLLQQFRKEFFVEIIVPSRVSMDENFVIRGGREAINKAKQRMQELVEEMSYEVAIEVPCEFVPYLRNNVRSTVTPIELKCNVWIEFPNVKQNEDASSIIESYLIVHGTEENCNIAAQMIKDSAPIESSIDVPKQYHGRIIGRGGRELARIKQESGVSDIIIPDRDIPLSSSIILRGTTDSVFKAREMISQRVSNSGAAGTRYNNKGGRSGSNTTTLCLNIPKHMHPRIVGRGGVTINRLRGEFGVEIILPGVNSHPSDTSVSVCGVKEKCEAAIEEIQRIISQDRPINPRNDDRRAQAESQARPHQRGDQLPVTKQALIDANAVPRLIGKRGWNIRRLREQFNVDVNFNTDPNNPDLVIVYGWDEESVNAAIDALKEQSADSQEAERFEGVEADMHDAFVNPQQLLRRERQQNRDRRPQHPPDTSDLNEFPLF